MRRPALMRLHACMQVVDMLIFKGREELETYLMMHKQRHHLVSGCMRRRRRWGEEQESRGHEGVAREGVGRVHHMGA
jgi:hypothetical protein